MELLHGTHLAKLSDEFPPAESNRPAANKEGSLEVSSSKLSRSSTNGSKLEDKLSIPVPKVDQDWPSHLAMLLALIPPIFSK